MLRTLNTSRAKAFSGISLDNGITGVIDIGTSKVSCFIIRNGLGSVDGPEMEVIGVGHQAAAGVGEGGLVELAADSAIRAAVDKAERMAGERLEAYHIAICSRHIACRRVAVDLDLDGVGVAQEDIDACFKEGSRLAAASNMVPLHIWPSRFTIDGVGGVRDPRGIECENLSVEMVSLSASATAIKAVKACLDRCNLKPASFIAAPYASALAVLHEEELDMGVLCLDMGANLTGFSIFRDGALVFAGAVPVGSDHITRDIALGLGISRDAAERLKTVHGTAWCVPGDEGRLIDLPQDAGARDAHIPVTELAGIIGPRFEETLKLVFERIGKAGIDMRRIHRTVLTGGGSQLSGAAEMMEALFKVRVRTGRAINHYGAPEAASGSAFAVCSGMVGHLATQPDTRTAPKTPLMTGHLNGHEAEIPTLPGGIMGRAVNWLRVNF
ncbi:cell division protein FtsA [Parvularcula flava]|uniref:Cell division protein FtsA n=1 Tax=Aquisalinus luteolus TaxID=1566827 RepID=A0A8J3A3Z0_9PROT|nr:cell division protein FtsA [Aquisalinus luteolus]NHK29052.1 cell division protein FtsA [Aquisalinus luteolus]GGI00459.1 cell division protein FtsA [Aquisalinus luteolus]